MRGKALVTYATAVIAVGRKSTRRGETVASAAKRHSI